MSKKQKIDPLMTAYKAVEPIINTSENLNKYRKWKPNPLTMNTLEFQNAQNQRSEGIRLLEGAMAAFRNPEDLEQRLDIIDLAYAVQEDLNRKLPKHKKYDETEIIIFKARALQDLGYHGSAIDFTIDEIDKMAKVLDLRVNNHKEKYAILHLALAGFYINAGENSVAEELLKDMVRAGLGDIESLGDQSAKDLLEIVQRNKEIIEARSKKQEEVSSFRCLI